MTITSNVWFNLSAWASGSFTLGQRCSNAGNAYQCTTAGTSSAAPTGTGASINNGGTAVFEFLSTVNYTSFNAYCAAAPATQTDNAVVQGWNGSPGTPVTVPANGNAIDYSGVTAGSFTTLFCCAAGESFRDHSGANPLAYNAANGLTFLCPSSGTVTPNSGAWFRISVDNTTIDGFQLRDPNTSSDAHVVALGASNCTIRGCLFDTSMIATDTVQVCYMTAPNVNIVNSLIIQRSLTTGAAHTVKWELGVGATGAAVNCTIISTTNTTTSDAVCGLENAGQVRASNCAIFGYSNPINSQNAAGAVSADHCCFSASSLANSLGDTNTDGGNNIYSATAANEFIDAATDFRVKALADLIGAGATDTAYISTADDIFRFARTAPWDIGAASYRAPSSSTAKSGSSMLTEVDAILADGQGSSAITPARMRSLIEDFAVSFLDALNGGSAIANYASDAAAAAGGVPVNGFYRNGSNLMVRVS